MAFNLSSLQQKQDQLIVTIDEIVEMLRKLPGTGYQNLQYFDRNGNLVQKQIPNIGQLIEQFRQGVNSQMQKTLYVDAENGSDESGDGSGNAPFKTINTALKTVPSGGFALILLVGDYEVNKDIKIDNKVVLITSAQSNNNVKIRFKAHQVDDKYYDYYRFILGLNSLLRFHYIDFELGEGLPNLTPKTEGLINCFYSQNSSVVLGACSITLDGTQSFIKSTAHGAVLPIGIYHTDIKTNGSYVIDNKYSPCILTKNAVTIDDDTKWVTDSNYLIS